MMSLSPLARLLAVVIGGIGGCTSLAQSPLGVDALYDSGAVLQRDVALSVRGFATPGDTVHFSSAISPDAAVVADADGRFVVPLGPLPAGGPHAYRLSSGGQAVTVRDVYVGDVFLLSGQSNVEWPVGNTEAAEEASAKTDPGIRHVKIPLTASESPRRQLPAGVSWEGASPATTPKFSAVGFYLAEALRERDPDVPIGLVNSSWGGSRIEAWLPAEIAGAVGSLDVPADVRDTWSRLRETYPDAFSPGGNAERPGGTGGVATEVGKRWEWAGYDGIDGEIYFDRVIALGEGQARQPATLSLGPVDDSDSTWVNGQFVGSLIGAYATPREYRLPKGVLRAGDNRVTVWVDDTGGQGGINRSPDSIFLAVGEERIPLRDGWTSRPRRLVLDSLRQPQQAPTLLYNGMLHPLRGFAFAAAVWYQGESNAGDLAEARAYGQRLSQLAGVIREVAGRPDLPLLIVELPEWQTASELAYEGIATWPEIRRQQQLALATDTLSASVVTLGYGDELDIHPRTKRPVGRRIAAVARRLVYGDEGSARQARPVSAEAMGQAYSVRFEDVGQGLTTADGQPVTRLAVRDGQGVWHAASGQVQGTDRLRVVPPAGVGDVTAVAYAWANTPAGANLVNGYGWPVSSFRVELKQ